MQKRKIEDSAIFEAYNRIMSGESLTVVAKDIGLDRGTLRKYIEVVVEPNLDENKRLEFEQVINRNFRGNSTENKRKNRNGIRKRATEEIEKSEAIKELANYGVTPEQIEDLYKRLKSDKRTTFSRDTYIYKYLEHLNVLRGLGFTSEDVFDIFMKRPKLFTSSANKMLEIFNTHLLYCSSTEVARQKFIQYPWIDLKNKEPNSNINEIGEPCGGGER